MPHQRKYVAHSGGIDACPAREKRSMAAYASHGFSSRLSRSARCALLSFTSLTLASAETEARGTGRSGAHSTYFSGTSTHDLQRAHFATTRPVADSTRRIALRMITSSSLRATTFVRHTGHRPSSVAGTMTKLYILDRNCQEWPGAAVDL